MSKGVTFIVNADHPNGKMKQREPSQLASTVADFFQYLRDQRRLSPLTLRAYRTDIGQFLAWCERTGRPLTVDTLDRQLLGNYIRELGHLAPNSVRRKIAAVGGWCEYLLFQGTLRMNPARKLPLPKKARRLPRYPSPDECKAVLAAARSPLECAVIWLLATTGLRRAELVGLDLADLAPDLADLRVIGKGNAERRLPLPDRTQAVLKDYLMSRASEAKPLLVSRAGTRLGVTSLRRIFTRLLRRAALEGRGYSLHSMRHAYAVMLLRSGADLVVIQRLLGHTSLEVTASYLSCDQTTRREAVARLPILIDTPIGDGLQDAGQVAQST